MRHTLARPGAATVLVALAALLALALLPAGVHAEEACGYSGCHNGAPPPGDGYGTEQPPAKAATSVTIGSSTSRVIKPRPFVLSGVLKPAAAGTPVSVYVRKPGKAYWSCSSARLCYAATADGGASWWYRYTPAGPTSPRGTYAFKVSFAGDDGHEPCVSALVSVSVR